MITHNNIKFTAFIIVLLIVLFNKQGYTQTINFSLASTENIILEPVTDIELDFNVTGSGNGTYLLPGQTGPFVIDRVNFNEELVIFRITAPDYADLTVEVSKTTDLTLVCEGEVCPNPLPTIPYQVGWSFWNNGHDPLNPDPSILELVASSTEILSSLGAPLPFSFATFPMAKRSLGDGPPVPPTPESGAYVNAPSKSAYLLIYGGIANLPNGLQAGNYQGMISINVTAGGS
jgi:hypothetical protein